MTRVIAGIGCRRGCEEDIILAVIADACARVGRSASALASASFKGEELGLREAAEHLGIPLILIGPAALAAAQARCATLSPHVEAAVGVPSVSEASALAAAGDGARLILPRITAGGATCALAETAAP